MVLTGVGTTKVAKERQAPSTDNLTGVAAPYETEPRHQRQNPSSEYVEYTEEAPINYPIIKHWWDRELSHETKNLLHVLGPLKNLEKEAFEMKCYRRLLRRKSNEY